MTEKLPRHLSCTLCRQSKVRCNAFQTYPSPCKRCESRQLRCTIDSNYKRVPTRKRLEMLTKELEELKGCGARRVFNHNPLAEGSSLYSGEAAATSVFGGAAKRVPLASVGSTGINKSTPGTLRSGPRFELGDISLRLDEAKKLFDIYTCKFQVHFPVLDVGIDPESVYFESELLFWTIIFTVGRTIPIYHFLNKSSDVLSDLASKMMAAFHPDPIPAIQALLMLSVWPSPVKRQVEDKRWVICGAAMQMIFQNGLHQVGNEQEYRALGYINNSEQDARHTRIWRCGCFAMSMLSCELGLPCLVPFNALEVTPADAAALSPEFLSKLRVMLFVSRINDITGRRSRSEDTGHQLRMVHLLEMDLEVLVSPFRLSFLHWTTEVEFLCLVVQLNLYCSCLHGPPPTAASPELQYNAANVASRIIAIFASTYTAPEDDLHQELQPRVCYPKSYMKFGIMATFALLKIVFLGRLPIDQKGQAAESIRLSSAALLRCSSQVGDEFHSGARVIEILCREGVIGTAQNYQSVKSRFGASLFFELLMAAVIWRKSNDQANVVGSGVPSSDAAPLQHEAEADTGTQSVTADPNDGFLDSEYWTEFYDFSIPGLDSHGTVTSLSP